MRARQFSFKSIIPPTQSHQNEERVDSSELKSTTKGKTSNGQSYKQKYQKCKQNVGKFMELVERQFQNLIQSHMQEKSKLNQQILSLRNQLRERTNQISNFTVRSKKINNTGQTNRQSKNVYQQLNGNTLSFDGIQSFDQSVVEKSKIHKNTKNLMEQNFSNISASNTLLELDRALSSSYASKKTDKNSFRLQDLSLTSHSMNHNAIIKNCHFTQHYFSRALSKKKSQSNKENLKLDIDGSLGSFSKSEYILKETQKSNVLTRNRTILQNDSKNASICKQKPMNQLRDDSNTNQHRQGMHLKQNTSSGYEIHSMLKNLRNTMQKNIEKQSNLQASQDTIFRV